MKDINLREKYEEIKVRAKETDALVLCRNILFGLLCIVLLTYLVPMVLVFPFHYESSKGYLTIGTAKANFFDIYANSTINLMCIVLPAYVLVALLVKGKECVKNKVKFTECIKTFFRNISVTDWFMILYAISLLVSYGMSDYRQTAYRGTMGWYMGLVQQLIFIGSYFAISRLVKKGMGRWIIFAMLAVATAVFGLGILNRYSVDLLGMQSPSATFISTIGNINWLCGYWAVVYPLVMGLHWMLEKGSSPVSRYSSFLFWMKKVSISVCLMTGFVLAVTNGSDSGVIAGAATLFLLACMSLKNARRLQSVLEMIMLFTVCVTGLMIVQCIAPQQNDMQTELFKLLVETPIFPIVGAVACVLYCLLCSEKTQEKTVAFFSAAWKVIAGVVAVTAVSFLAAVIVNTTNPGYLGALSEHDIFTFNNDWGSKRGATWTAGVGTWVSQDTAHKFFGVGPDCMADYIYKGPDVALRDAVKEEFGTQRLTNAHCEWITVLANLGVFGLISYVGMMLSAMVRFLKAGKTGAKYAAFSIACGLGLFCYTINSIFSFQQMVCIVPLFIVLGLGEGFLRESSRRRDARKYSISN